VGSLFRPVPTDPDGYLALLDLAGGHPGLGAWAIEGTRQRYGAGLTCFAAEAGERVIELDRPQRASRRGGAKSDLLDAIRAAREALGRIQLTTPRAGGERAALSVLLAGRRSAVDGTRVHEQDILTVVRSWRPDLLDHEGVGPIVATTELCARSRPGRCRTDRAYSMLWLTGTGRLTRRAPCGSLSPIA
jgi:hypothetical protein